MNQNLEGKVPVAEEIQEIQNVDEAMQTEYKLASDGTIEKVKNESETAEVA